MSAEANRTFLHRYIDEVISEDERIAFRSTMRGTHREKNSCLAIGSDPH